MSVLFRKSKKIAPGVKINASKNGLGVTLGGPLGRVSVSPKGQVSVGQSIPGTGIYTKKVVGQVGGKQNASDCEHQIDGNNQAIDYEAPAKITITATKAHKLILDEKANELGITRNDLVISILNNQIAIWAEEQGIEA